MLLRKAVFVRGLNFTHSPLGRRVEKVMVGELLQGGKESCRNCGKKKSDTMTFRMRSHTIIVLH
jgi:hypothetical protein